MAIEEMRYYRAAAMDYRSMSLAMLAHHYSLFAQVHKREIRFRMMIHGAKVK